MEIKLAKRDRRLDPKVVGIAEAELADPSKVGRVLEGTNALHLVLEGFGGKVDVEHFDDAVDLVSLLGREGRDGAAFKGHNSVVLMGAAEMPVRCESGVSAHLSSKQPL